MKTAVQHIQGFKCKIALALVLCVAIVAVGSGTVIGEEKPTDVVVTLPKNLALPQAHVLIYRVPDKDNDWPVVQADVAREMEREVKVSLPDGEYIAEIGAAEGNVLTLLRSESFRVPATKRVNLLAEKHSCGATISGKDARLLQVALRRVGNGDLRWSAETSPPPVTLIISTGQPYVASCVAYRDHKYLAKWTPKEAIKKSRLTFTDSDAVHQLEFAIREDTPTLVANQVIAMYPDAQIKIDDAARSTLVSNRPQVYLDYQTETKAGEKLYYTGGYCQIDRRSKFEMGGPLSPKMFAGFIWSENGGWSSGDVYARVEMVDPGGCIFDINRSKLQYREEKFFAPENEKPVPLEANKPGWQGFKSESILVKVEFIYGGRTVTSECRGEYFVRAYSEHFSLATPPMWMFKARQFLSCLEAIRELTRKNTGRPGPVSFQVDWRGNGSDAKAMVGDPNGGAHNMWMSFPWWTFDAFWDPFSEPWFGNHDPYVCHEMLHTFGYHHSDEMSRLEWRAEDQYRSLRWQAVDKGEWPVWQTPLRDSQEVKP